MALILPTTSAFLLPVHPTAVTANLVRTPAPVPVMSFEETLIGQDWDTMLQLAAAHNAAEDFGGVVGGSYIYGAGAVAAVVGFFALNSRAQEISAALDGEQARTLRRADVVIVDSEIAAASPARGKTWWTGGFEWIDGPVLPSIEELESACIMIAEGHSRNLFICLDPPEGVDCTQDNDYSVYYGRDVFLCPM